MKPPFMMLWFLTLLLLPGLPTYAAGGKNAFKIFVRHVPTTPLLRREQIDVLQFENSGSSRPVALITFLVEDNLTIRENLIPALEDLANARVVGFAETEEVAASWLTEHRNEWHLAIVDLFLREGSGLGVLASCRARKRHQKVVVLSNYATRDMRERCMAMGADAVFDKSTELEALIEYCDKNRPSVGSVAL